MPTFNTDKIEPHQYFKAYVGIAADLGPSATVCEIGVLGGESLRMWQALYPTGQIYGIDANADCTWPEGTHRVVGDATVGETVNGLPAFNLIIDDGAHHSEQIGKSFELMWPKLLSGGYYVIEDWMVSVRDAKRPGETWGESWGADMQNAVTHALHLLNDQDAECDFITYRFGLCIIHKRA